MVAEMMSFQVVVVDEGLSADGADDADAVLQRLLVDPPEVLFERVLAEEVLVAVAELASGKEKTASMTSETFFFHYFFPQSVINQVPQGGASLTVSC